MQRSKHRLVWALSALAISVLGGQTTAAVEPGLKLRLDPLAEEIVFDWQRDRCADWDIPDAPARAFRDANGSVHRIAANDPTRAAIGATLDLALHDCAPLYTSGRSADPADRDDRAWLASFFTSDGRRVEALAHVEYQGHRHPGRCAADGYMACWRNAIVGLVSDDGGRTFTSPLKESHLVAGLPYRYSGEEGRRTGYFNPSNIVRWNGYLYAFVVAERWEAQARGVCLLRRPIDGTNADWRAFDGTGFETAFADVYQKPDIEHEAHVCKPLAGVSAALSSVVRHQPSGLFVAVSPMTAKDPDGRPVSGIYWRQSADLIHWSRPRLLKAEPLLWRHDCSTETVVAYPSLLDADSASMVFDTADDSLWLYLVRLHLEGCSAGKRRDLVRLPLRIRDAGSGAGENVFRAGEVLDLP